MSDPRLRDVVLRHGSHTKREHGMCAMELAAYLAGEEHSDDPSCVHPDLRALVITLNDSYTDDHQRTAELMPLVLASIGTAGTVIDIATTQKTYDDATAPARNVFHEAVATAHRAYNAAIAPVKKVYDDAIATARKVYDNAIATARRECIAALLDATKANTNERPTIT